MREIIRRIKRNPVLNIFITVAVGQFAHDYLAGAVQWDDIVTYLATLVMGVIARMYVVPVEDHEDLKDHNRKLGEDLNNLLEESYKRSGLSKENGSN